MAANAALAKLLPEADSDIVEYLAATAETELDDGDGDLAAALAELLISYELCDTEDAAHDLCSKLSAELSSAATTTTAAAAPSLLLSKPLQMGDGADDAAAVALTPLLGRATTDALGNAVSLAARANACAAAQSKTAPAEDDAADEPDAEGCFGLLRQSAATAAERQRREAAEREAAARAREAACELYLASKAGGGSRDISLKSILLLSPAEYNALGLGADRPLPVDDRAGEAADALLCRHVPLQRREAFQVRHQPSLEPS